MHGVDPHAGLTSPNIAEAQTNRTLVEIGGHVTVLADHANYGEVGSCVFARLEQVHIMICDDGMTAAARELLDTRVGELLVVPVESK